MSSRFRHSRYLTSPCKSHFLEKLEERLLLSVRIDDVVVSEGDTGTTALDFVVSIDDDVAGGLTVDFVAEDATATRADNDYALAGEASPIVFGGFDLARGGIMSLADGSFVAAMRQSLLDNFPGSSISSSGELTAEFLADIDVLVLGVAPSFTSVITPLSVSEQSALSGFIDAGGGALILVDNDSFAGAATDASNESLVDPFSIDVTGTINNVQPGAITASHPVTTGPFGQVNAIQANFPGYFDDVGPAQVLSTWPGGQPSVVVVDRGEVTPNGGRALLVADTSIFADQFSAVDNETFLLNAISFLRRDFEPVSGGTLSFVGAAGEQQTITVLVHGDGKVELDETFTVSLSNPQASASVSLADAEAIGTILNDDAVPIANAGGPYTVIEGSTLQLNGSNSTDADGDIVSFAWDFDNDDLFNDAVGPSPILNADGIMLGTQFEISLRVTDAGGNVDTALTTVTLQNAPPRITSFVGVSKSETGVPVTFSAAALDPGGDPMTFTYEFADGSPPQSGVNLTTIQHTFATNGVYLVRLTVDDQEGGVANATFEVTVGQGIDFGDAPDTYGTTLAADGPRHLLGSGLTLGSAANSEGDGSPHPNARGETDDFDTFTSNLDLTSANLFMGGRRTIRVNASDVGKLNAWIDFDFNGTFDANNVTGMSEQIANDIDVQAGENQVMFAIPIVSNVPTDANGNYKTVMRLRLSTQSGLGPKGPAPDGEVEDHEVEIRVTTGTVVTTSDLDGPGSLRSALEFADDSPGIDTIIFNIPGPGPHQLVGRQLRSPVIIDGFSQPGARPATNALDQPSNAMLPIQITGGIRGWELTPDAAGSQFRGLVLHDGVRVPTGEVHEITIQGNYFPGSLIQARGESWLIGGDEPGDGNWFGGGQDLSGNQAGVITVTGDNHRIERNRVGFDLNGVPTGVPSDSGIQVLSGDGNVVGGTEERRNIISGAEIGILLNGGSDNEVSYNYVGTDLTGLTAVPNGEGIHLLGSSNNLLLENVTSGNHRRGIWIVGGSENSILSGIVGLSADQSAALGNGDGIVVANSPSTQIGTAAVSGGAVIAAAEGDGESSDIFAEPRPLTGSYIQFRDEDGELEANRYPDFAMARDLSQILIDRGDPDDPSDDVRNVLNASFFFQQCFGGGFLDDLRDEFEGKFDFVAASAAQWNEVALGAMGAAEQERRGDEHVKAYRPDVFPSSWTSSLVDGISTFVEDSVADAAHLARSGDIFGAEGKPFVDALRRRINSHGQIIQRGEFQLRDEGAESFHAILLVPTADHDNFLEDVRLMYNAITDQWGEPGASPGGNVTIDVLFGNGQAADGSELPEEWNAKPATRDNWRETLANVGALLNPKEQFLLYVSDHGGGTTNPINLPARLPPGARLVRPFSSSVSEQVAYGDVRNSGVMPSVEVTLAVPSGSAFDPTDVVRVLLHDQPVAELKPSEMFAPNNDELSFFTHFPSSEIRDVNDVTLVNDTAVDMQLLDMTWVTGLLDQIGIVDLGLTGLVIAGNNDSGLIVLDSENSAVQGTTFGENTLGEPNFNGGYNVEVAGGRVNIGSPLSHPNDTSFGNTFRVSTDGKNVIVIRRPNGPRTFEDPPSVSGLGNRLDCGGVQVCSDQQMASFWDIVKELQDGNRTEMGSSGDNRPAITDVETGPTETKVKLQHSDATRPNFRYIPEFQVFTPTGEQLHSFVVTIPIMSDANGEVDLTFSLPFALPGGSQLLATGTHVDPSGEFGWTNEASDVVTVEGPNLPGGIRALVYSDEDEDHEFGFTEEGIEGVQVRLEPSGITQTTTRNGEVEFTNLAPGEYEVTVLVGDSSALNGFQAVHPNPPTKKVVVEPEVFFSEAVDFGFNQVAGASPDIDANGEVDDGDIDLLAAALRGDSQDSRFDLNGDSVVDKNDYAYLVDQVLGVLVGDINLDGQVDFVDFLPLSNNFGETDTGWSSGDLNGDGVTNFADFLLFQANFGN